MTLAWVIGTRGLLGSALCRALRSSHTNLFLPPELFFWSNAETLTAQFAKAIDAFATQAHVADSWQIYWAAGVGTMGSSTSDMIPETHALSVLLDLLKAEPRLSAKPGVVTLASSAGAIYAGCSDEVITEKTPPTPTTAYAHAKLEQEELLTSLYRANNKVSVFIARISTLYGPGNSVGKPQGLITHIARCILRNRPIQIYVPIDTIRDYITADDAAQTIVKEIRTVSGMPGVYIKIIASGRPVTIAEIISIYKRLTRRAPRIVTSVGKLSSVYARRIQFRLEGRPEPRTSLVVGIAQVMAAERALYTTDPAILK